MDRGAWQATLVAMASPWDHKSWTRLRRLSTAQEDR